MPSVKWSMAFMACFDGAMILFGRKAEDVA